MPLIFALILFLNSFLMFTLQPLQAKSLLPILGGVPTVWTICVFFFQSVVLLGCLYAIGLSRLSIRFQIFIHSLLVVAIATLGIGVLDAGSFSNNASGSPIIWLLGTLATTVGPAFFLISTNSPLLQSWFYRAQVSGSKNPYILYAAGSFGSFMGLISYPVWVEPALALGDQYSGWLLLFRILSVNTLLIAAWLWMRSSKDSLPLQNKKSDDPPSGVTLGRWSWVFLAFVPSSLMLGLTTFVTTDIAPLPFLWAVPLLLYMLSFIIVFLKWNQQTMRWTRNASLVLAGFAILSLALPLLFILIIHFLLFFLICLACHGQIAFSKPHPGRMTEYYFLISFGGVLGSLFNALLAPLLFINSFEYPLVMAIGAVLCFNRSVLDFKWIKSRSTALNVISLIVGIGAFGFLLKLASNIPIIGLFQINFSNALVNLLRNPVYYATSLMLYAFLTGGLVFVFFKSQRSSTKVIIGLSLGLLLYGQIFNKTFIQAIYKERNFYGILTVSEDNKVHTLKNGVIIHGEQWMGTADQRLQPRSYFHRSGPLGDIWKLVDLRVKNPRIAVIGLGIGTIAAYGTDQSHIDFFEINPHSETLARNPQLFTYVEDCLQRKCSVDITIGDGRLELEKSVHKYDLIIIDAFTSDAIPVHLLTVEAFKIYLSRLAAGGVIALHVTNRYVNLEEPLQSLADSLNLHAAIRSDRSRRSVGKRFSRWVTLWHPTTSEQIALPPAWSPLKSNRNLRPWTDNYVNLLGTLKF